MMNGIFWRVLRTDQDDHVLIGYDILEWQPPYVRDGIV